MFFLQSALRTFDSTLCRFPSSWLEVATHHGSLLSQHCIAYWISAWSDEMEPALFKILLQWKQVSSFFRAECGSCQKLNSTECRLHVCQEQYAQFKASQWQQERTDSEPNSHPK